MENISRAKRYKYVLYRYMYIWCKAASEYLTIDWNLALVEATFTVTGALLVWCTVIHQGTHCCGGEALTLPRFPWRNHPYKVHKEHHINNTVKEKIKNPPKIPHRWNAGISFVITKFPNKISILCTGWILANL